MFSVFTGTGPESAGPILPQERNRRLAGNIEKGTEHRPTEPRVHTQLASAWMSRLQILSIVATFLAGIDSQFLSLSRSDPSMDIVITILSGALMFHLATAIISFTSSFILIHHQITVISGPLEGSVVMSSFVAEASGPPNLVTSTQMVSVQRVSLLKRKKVSEPVVAILDTETPELKFGMPVALLTRCHNLCILLCVLGFLLTIVGIMTYIWNAYTMVTGIFSSVCIAVSFLGAVVVFH